MCCGQAVLLPCVSRPCFAACNFPRLLSQRHGDAYPWTPQFPKNKCVQREQCPHCSLTRRSTAAEHQSKHTTMALATTAPRVSAFRQTPCSRARCVRVAAVQNNQQSGKALLASAATAVLLVSAASAAASSAPPPPTHSHALSAPSPASCAAHRPPPAPPWLRRSLR